MSTPATNEEKKFTVNAQDTLPAYCGHGLGHIIHKNTLKLRVRMKELEEAEARLKAEAQLQTEEQQKEANTKKNVGIVLQIERVKKLTAEVERLVQGNQESHDQSLPLDLSASPLITTVGRSAPSERLTFKILETRETVGKMLPRLIKEVTDPSTAVLLMTSLLQNSQVQALNTSSSNTTIQMSDSRSALENSRKRTIVVGSFITLPQVRAYSKIVIPKNTVISEEIVKNAEEYCVINEAVLGALFLGFGEHEVNEGEGEKGLESAESVMRSMTSFELITQGAICPFEKEFNNFNMWKTYCQWKDKLMDKENSEFIGFPIAYKMRELKDILSENNVKPKESTTVSSS